jgi:levanase/fructan beta-fructosidase
MSPAPVMLRPGPLLPIPMLFVVARLAVVCCTADAQAPHSRPPAAPLYHEALRPQFHFTARYWDGYTIEPGNDGREGWINDVNGPVWLDGEYHLFGQRWFHAWLHAVSKDLVHWTELKPAFGEGGKFRGTQSGTCVVDYKNVSGLGDGKTPVLIAFWAAEDNQNQCISFSSDHGRTWTKWDKNPVLAHPYRDPKVFWHEPTKKWIMLLCGPPDYSYLIFTSADLLHWRKQSSVPNMFECPDMFSLPLDGDEAKTKWVVVNGDARYLVGDFDGTVFKPSTRKKTGDWGGAAYATQTFNNMPSGDLRRIQVAWLRGGRWPRMPFNQQWSFPVEMTLHTRPDGPTVYRYPIREIEKLWDQKFDLSPLSIGPGENPLANQTGKYYDIDMELDVAGSDASEIVLELAGRSKVRYLIKDKVLESCGSRAPLAAENGRVELRVLLDRTSVEVFGNRGVVSISKCMLPDDSKPPLVLSAVGGKAKFARLTLHTLKSMWE